MNQIWALSKHSLNATTFTGTYIDGDRERIPYEREALISQLGHYNVDREFSIARHSHEYLIHNPTWPTEWNMQSVWMAWNDYLYTGNSFSLEKHYPALKAKTLLSLREENGLISTRTGKQTQDFLNSINFKGKALQDIVDWPHTGILGLEKNEAGETDGFIFSDYNNVVNAYHYKSLCLMSMIAEALGKEKDKIEFIKLANQFKKDFNRAFLDMEKGYYNDGIGIDHSSLHGNMFPLVFGLVPDKNIETTLKFIRSRKMACSISNALFLMETLYENNDAEYALKLLSSVKERSWYNTIRIGSTLTIEAWDNKYKPNLDWNQSAGSAPASIIARKLMGIEPLMPGFEKIRVKPQPSTLNYAEIKLPTVRGEVYVAFNNIPNEVFSMNVRIPANTTAEIWLPLISKKYTLIVNGNLQKGMEDGNFIKVELGSGEHSLAVN